VKNVRDIREEELIWDELKRIVVESIAGEIVHKIRVAYLRFIVLMSHR